MKRGAVDRWRREFTPDYRLRKWRVGPAWRSMDQNAGLGSLNLTLVGSWGEIFCQHAAVFCYAAVRLLTDFWLGGYFAAYKPCVRHGKSRLFQGIGPSESLSSE